MKIGFVLGSPKISGGTYVIFQHAVYLQRKGHKLYFIISKENNEIEQLNWHEAFRLIPFIPINKFRVNLDLVIATWWESPYLLYKIKSKQYAYFVQSIEAYFFNRNNLANQHIAHQSYELGLPIITEATWIKEDLEKKFIKNIFLVKNGILKNRYTTKGPIIECKNEQKLRCLVEGPIDTKFKLVKETIYNLKKSNADEIWLLTSSNINEYEGCNKVFSNVNPADVPAIMRSCDILVKQSIVEGMFGPPLEMFHCGGTAVVSNVTGYDEYIKNEYNALVNKTLDFEQMIKNVNILKNNKYLLNKLKSNALKTAKLWPSWDQQSYLFEESLFKIINLEKVNRYNLYKKTLKIYKYAEFIKKTMNCKQTYAERYVMDNNNKNFYFNKKKYVKKIIGITISNEHIQELWHPLFNKLNFDYRYFSIRPLNEYILWDKDLSINSERLINKEKCFICNWIKDPKLLYDTIEEFAPDFLIIHSGSHPAYQKIIREINFRYEIPILFSELGWFPQKYNFYIDNIGTNAKSSIAYSSIENFIGVSKNSTPEIKIKEFKNNNVLIILQLETDMNFLLSNKYFNSNDQFIEYVINSIPKKYNIIIKPHPLDYNASRYEKFVSDKITISNDNFQDLIEQCNSVIGINSTCLLESLLYDVNIYKCGNSLLDNKNLAIEFNNKNLDKIWKNNYIDNSYRLIFVNELKKYQINVKKIDDLSCDNKSLILLNNAKYKELFLENKEIQSKRINNKKGNRILCKSLDELLNKIIGYDIISLDLFNTLIDFKYLQPNDLHKIISIKVASIVNSSKFDHEKYRIKAEEIVRSNTLNNEISLKEIYAQYLLLTCLPAFIVNKICELEINTLLTLTKIRNSGKKIFDFAKETDKIICITSDFYIGKIFIEKLLKHNNYDINKSNIYISCDLNLSKKNGTMYKYLEEKYPDKKILHIGDNFQVDVKQALDNGIDSLHFPSNLETQKCSKPSFNYFEKVFNNQIFNNYNIEQSFALSEIVSMRYDNPFSVERIKKIPNNIKDIGFSFLGPIITSFTFWLLNKINENKIDTILFLSRDGYLLKKAFDLLIKKLNLNIQTHYLYSSRKFLNLININYDFNNINEIIDTRISKCKIKYFLSKRFEIDADTELSTLDLQGTGFTNFDDIMELPKDKGRILLLCKNIRSIIIKKSIHFLKNYKDYLFQEIHDIKNSKFAIVDIGYFGSMQNCLQNIFNEYNTKLLGFYFATRKEIYFSEYLSKNCYGFLADKYLIADLGLPSICRKFGSFEFLLSAPHGSLDNIYIENEEIKIKLIDSSIEKEQFKDLIVLHNNALKFIYNIICIYSDLKKIGINYLDFSKFHFEYALGNILDNTDSEISNILKNFVLENLYSLEITPFTLNSFNNKINKTTINKKINNNISNNNLFKQELHISNIDNIDKHFEFNKKQLFFINIYKFISKKFMNKKYYLKLEKNPSDFFKDSKNKFNVYFYIFLKKLSKK